MLPAVGADGQVGRFLPQVAPVPHHGQAAPVAAGPSAVGRQRVLLQPHRVFQFHQLGRDVGNDGPGIGQAVVGVLVGTGAPGPGHQVEHDEGVPPLPVAADQDEGVASLSGGRHPVWQHLGQGAEQGVRQAEAHHAPHAGGGRHDRVQDGSLRGDDLQGAEEARGVGDVGPHHGAHRVPAAGDGEGEGRVDAALHLGAAPGEVDFQGVPPHAQLHLERDGAGVHAVVVQVVLENVLPVRPGTDLGPYHPLGQVQQLFVVAVQDFGPVAVHQLEQALFAGLAGRQLGPDVSQGHHRDPDVLLQDLKDAFRGAALLVELQGRQAQAFLEDLGVVAGGAARHPPADVQVVGHHRREAHQGIPVEDGLKNEDVGQVDASVEGIVHDEHVPRSDPAPVLVQSGLQGEGDGAQLEGNGDSLRDHPALAVAQGRGKVHAVANHRGVGRPDHGVGHFVGDAAEIVSDQAQGDGVDPGIALSGHGMAFPGRFPLLDGSASLSDRLPAPSVQARQPGGTTMVVSNSSISRGPWRGFSRSALASNGHSIHPWSGPK